jgi:hypothetical protein
MYYTSQQISKINSSKSAIQGKKYYQNNGLIWIGLYSKTLKQFNDPEINAQSVVYQIENNEPFTVTEELDSLNNNLNIVNGNKVFTYDISKNLTQIKVYSDITLTDLLSTKNLTYDVNGNLTTLVEITPTNTITSTFTYNIDGDLTNKTIT